MKTNPDLDKEILYSEETVAIERVLQSQTYEGITKIKKKWLLIYGLGRDKQKFS